MILPVRSRHDVELVRCEARTFARDLGFDPRESVELAIVAVELATNIIKYGVFGHLELLPLEGAGGLMLHACDHGPPFRDFETAQVDGQDDLGPIDPALFASRRGIGGGLGAVKRFSDRIEAHPWKDGGKRITIWRFRRCPPDTRQTT